MFHPFISAYVIILWDSPHFFDYHYSTNFLHFNKNIVTAGFLAKMKHFSVSEG